jgi:hypothetical protein
MSSGADLFHVLSFCLIQNRPILLKRNSYLYLANIIAKDMRDFTKIIGFAKTIELHLVIYPI